MATQLDQYDQSDYVSTMRASGWDPDHPSTEFTEATAAPRLLDESRSLSDLDRLALHVRLVQRIVLQRFGYPQRKDHAGRQFVAYAALIRALHSAGITETDENGAWIASGLQIEKSLQQLEDWEKTRLTDAMRKWEEASRNDDFTRELSAFEPVLTEVRLLLGHTDHRLDLRTMQAVLCRNDREGIGQSHVTLKEMPDLVEMLRRTGGKSGDQERRLYQFEDGKIRLDLTQARRGLDWILEPPPEDSCGNISLESTEGNNRQDLEVEDEATKRVPEIVRIAMDSQKAQAAIAELRASAKPGSTRRRLLSPALMNLLIEGERGAISSVAQQIQRDESTVRGEWQLILSELRRRVSG